MSDGLNTRLRRLRRTPVLREMVRETHLSMSDFILPIFVKEGLKEPKPIASMPGHYQWPLEDLPKEIKQLNSMGIKSVILFGIPSEKDECGSSGYQADGIIARAIETTKDACPQMMVISDICCCEYTSHGHCGAINEFKEVDNDRTLELLAKQAHVHARAGADMLAPSGMMDGQVACLRQALDTEGYTHIPIMSYAAKYCSSLYGPFREAAEGAPQFGDRRSYQMDPANGREALREVALDIAEGADILMVKPAHTYLDVIQAIKQEHPSIPLAAYHVSGEYAMIKAAAMQGWIDEEQVALEVLTSIKRAGASLIINYFTKQLAHHFD